MISELLEKGVEKNMIFLSIAEVSIGTTFNDFFKYTLNINWYITLLLLFALLFLITRDIHEIAIIAFPAYLLLMSIGFKISWAIVLLLAIISIYEIFNDNVVISNLIGKSSG